MSDLSEPESYGGIWDDIATARKWRPILPMLDALEQAKGSVEKLQAIHEIAAFAIKAGLNEDPYANRSFLIFGKFIELLDTDDEWRAIFEDVVK